jgi:hypothetical protein
MDTGTQRVFRRFVLLGRSEGIRQEHVVSVFLEMVGDPAWGFPQQLYRDNGSEFFIFDLIRTALDQLQEEKAPTIINARPYAAASKPIESRFAVFDRFVFSQMPGWSGSVRMRKKTATLGKPPPAYPGTFEEFVREADDRIDDLEDRAIESGPFAGRSPIQLLTDHIHNGWRPLILPCERVDAAFCTRETRRVSRGYITVRGKTFWHRELVTGARVTVALPWRRSAAPLAFISGSGWVRLEPNSAFDPTSIEGARESTRRKREHDAAVRRLQVDAGHIDLQANRQDRQAVAPARPVSRPNFDFNVLPDMQALGNLFAEEAVQIPRKNPPRSDRRRRETDDLEAFLANRS